MERIFGVVKKRFHLLTAAPQYPIKTQSRLVLAACALHNFVVSYDSDDAILCNREEVVRQALPAQEEELGHKVIRAETLRSMERRNKIAKEMWDQYVAYKEQQIA